MSFFIDQKKCIVCFYCIEKAPDIFEINSDGKVKINDFYPSLNGFLSKQEELIYNEVKKNCPVKAIK